MEKKLYFDNEILSLKTVLNISYEIVWSLKNWNKCSICRPGLLSMTHKPFNILSLIDFAQQWTEDINPKILSPAPKIQGKDQGD